MSSQAVTAVQRQAIAVAPALLTSVAARPETARLGAVGRAALHAEETWFAAPEVPARVRAAQPLENLVLVLDLAGRIRSCSLGLGKLFGREPGETVGLEVSTLIAGLPLRTTTPGYNLAYVVCQFAASRWCRFCARDAAGNEFPVDVSIEPLALDGKRGFLLAVRPALMDGNGQVALRRLIAAAETRNDAVLVTDARGVIEYVNPAFELLTGFRHGEAEGQTPRILRSGVQDKAFYDTMWSALHGGDEFRCLITNRRKDGEPFHAEECIRPFVDGAGNVTHYVATLQDVSARVRAHARLNQLANYDSLTGLPNRNLFEDRLQQEIARSTRSFGEFALVFLDLDEFKGINDKFGHAAGDELLRTVGTRLKGCVRHADTVARLGGDEFALILLGVSDQEEVFRVLQKLRSVAKGVRLGETQVSLSVSYGVAVFPRDGDDESTLLRTADRAMYLAKAGNAADEVGLVHLRRERLARA